MRAQVWIDIPDGYELAEDTVRTPGDGEYFLDSTWSVQRDCKGQFNVSRFVIVRPAWKWPEWLKPGWISMDKDGKWYWWDQQPHTTDCEWMHRQAEFVYLNPAVLDITFPQCTNWTQSLRVKA